MMRFNFWGYHMFEAPPRVWFYAHGPEFDFKCFHQTRIGAWLHDKINKYWPLPGSGAKSPRNGIR